MSDIISLHTNLFPSIGFIQLQAEPADPQKNVQRIQDELSKAPPDPHSLLILPEFWAMGPVLRKINILADKTEELLGQLSDIAEQYQITIAGTLPEKVERDGNIAVFNSIFYLGDGKLFGKIRKQYLLPTNHDESCFSPGGQQSPVITPFGLIGGCIGNDIRFPDVTSDLCQQGTNIFTVPAHWPKRNINHWCTLLRARAIENQTYLVACNSVGSTNGLQLGGNSMVIDPEGEILINAEQKEGAFFVPMNWRLQENARKTFNTVALKREPAHYLDKVVAPEECTLHVTRRTMTGLKVVCVRLKWQNISEELLAFLHNMRKKSDFLVIVPDQPLVSTIHYSPLAALGCVDLVVQGIIPCWTTLENSVEQIVHWQPGE